jgi:hypothetical protein
MVLEKQFLFIIGAPRSGTTWLQAMLGAHPSICTTGELKLFDLFTGRWADAWEFQLRLQAAGGAPRGLTAVWTEAEFYRFLREFLERVYTRVLALKPQATVILDKSPGYSNYVEHISRLLPQAKFIHLIRDGRDVAVSLQAASRSWGRLWAPQEVESAAAFWKSTVLAAQKARSWAGRYLEVRYEALLTNGVPILRQVFDFAGLPMTHEEVLAIFEAHQFEKMRDEARRGESPGPPEGFFRKGRAGDWQNAFSPLERYVFHETAGDLLGRLGYAEGAWWVERPHERWTLPLRAMLTNPSRGRLKAAEALKRTLGPRWTERVRAARAWLKPDAQRSVSNTVKEARCT